MITEDKCPRCESGPPKVPPHPWPRQHDVFCPVCQFPLFLADDATVLSIGLPAAPAVPEPPGPPAPPAPTDAAPAVADDWLAPSPTPDFGEGDVLVGWIIGLAVVIGVVALFATVAFLIQLR